MKSIRRQLTVSMLIGFGLLLVSSSIAIYFFTRVAMFREFDSNLRAKALTIMSFAQQDEDGMQLDPPDTFTQERGYSVIPQYYELWNTNGNVCARSKSLSKTDLPMRFGSQPNPEIWNITLPNGHDGRAIGVKFSPKTEDEESGKLTPADAILVVASDLSSVDRTLNILSTVLAVTGLLTLVITGPVVSFSLRRGHASLERLGNQAADITADGLNTRFSVDAMPVELQSITTRLNDLLQRLEKSFERERRFSADLAHELRTPLAELRSLAEVELQWPEGVASEKHRETLNIALQMEAMVTRLLEMARCENGKVPLQIETIDIAPIIDEVWRSLNEKAKGKHILFTSNVVSPELIKTDRTLFRSIVANLLSNCVEYTPEKGCIEILWKEQSQELTISNTVYDLTEADLPYLFERFWRKDSSRTDNERCGLGLALIQTFSKLLGLTLTARWSAPNTLSISVRP